MERSCKPDIEFQDVQHAPLVTGEILENAKSKRDMKVFDYNSVSTDFITEEAKQVKGVEWRARNKIAEGAFDLVGQTPMVRLSRFSKKYGIECDLVAKCEFLSVGGSVKDRIGLNMINDAEASGRIKPGDTLVEPTSGNTGIALSLVATVKGYNMVIALPEKMSQEKVDTMVALGAQVVRTPTEAAWNDVDSNIGLAPRLVDSMPNSILLDQYKNPANPRAHYCGTAEEILEQCDGKIDMVVMTAGTGGTMTGCATKIKERCPNCKVVGVDPRGSILAEPPELNRDGDGEGWLVEGIGYDFIPSNLHRKIVDEWVKVTDEETFRLGREIVRTEGLLIGGSSGTAIAGAVKACRQLKPGQRCVVLFPDSSRNYMSKFMSDEWMMYYGFYPPPKVETPLKTKTVSDIANLFGKPMSTIDSDAPCLEASARMDKEKQSQLLVVDTTQKVVGVISQSGILKALLTGRASLVDPVEKHMVRKYKTVKPCTPLVEVAHCLNVDPFCVAINGDGACQILTSPDILRSL